MSLYAQFVKDRLGKEILEDEESYVTFCKYRDGLIVEDIYVHPHSRKKGLAIKRVDDVIAIAKSLGLPKIYVFVSTIKVDRKIHSSATGMTLAIINHGGLIDHTLSEAIVLSKEI